MSNVNAKRVFCSALFVLLFAAPLSAQIVFSGTAADPAGLNAVVDSFRAALGDPNNGVTAGSQPTGRREITWDGGGAGANAATFGIPMTNFANRGNVYTTPGTGFEISGQPSPEFGDINPTYPDEFQPFSSPRLFAALGSNIIDVHFTVPGTTDQPALSRGFGAVFSDVDLADVSMLEFFGAGDAPLGSWFVAAQQDNAGLSFLGVTWEDALIARVRITSGNFVLGPNDGPFGDGVVDVVALDDFIYGEPQAVAAIPEPATLLTLGAGAVLLGVAGVLRRRR